VRGRAMRKESPVPRAFAQRNYPTFDVLQVVRLLTPNGSGLIREEFEYKAGNPDDAIVWKLLSLFARANK
jgi:hypothetical protein